MRTPNQTHQSLGTCEEGACAGCPLSLGRGEDPYPCCSLAKVSCSPSRGSAGAGSHFRGFLEQREGLSTQGQSWASHPYLLILAHDCLTPDNRIIFLSAVKHTLKPSMFRLGRGPWCFVGLCTVGGQGQGSWRTLGHLAAFITHGSTCRAY